MKINTRNYDMDYTKKSSKLYGQAATTAVRILSKIGDKYVTAKKADYDDELRETADDRAYFGTI